VVHDNSAVAIQEYAGPQTRALRTRHWSCYHVTSPDSLAAGVDVPLSMRAPSHCL
jgi:hypothetical protein